MTRPRFLIVDGYPRESREEFRRVGMRLAGELYRDLLLKHLPDADPHIWLSSDGEEDAPSDAQLAELTGVLWPGCNLTVYHFDDPRVQRHLSLADRCFEAGVPGFGSCWAIQLACQVAGGEVAVNPRGREMGIGTKIHLTDAARTHPMFEGKPFIYSHLMSHDDYVTRLPEGATLLATNDWSPVQAVEVKYKNGVMWAVQYHPEYDLHEMARLIHARAERLIKIGYFRDRDEASAYAEKLEALHADPERKDLRWQLKIDDDIIEDALRELEFRNWIKHVIAPRLAFM